VLALPGGRLQPGSRAGHRSAPGAVPLAESGEEVVVVRGKQAPARWAARLARRIGLDANPLRRGTDRAEAWIRIGLVLVFLAAAPLAGWQAADWARSVANRATRTQQATERYVAATLLHNVPGSPDSPFGSEGSPGWVLARWSTRGGAVRTGSVQAPPGARAGSTVRVWTDRSGALTGPPLQRSQVRDWVLMIALLAPVMLALLLLVALGLSRQVLERRRMASWERAWSAVEPHWTRRGH
jgi:hypothetical protein